MNNIAAISWREQVALDEMMPKLRETQIPHVSQ
jgi:hypothetical protein